jgi:hypothetical protein
MRRQLIEALTYPGILVRQLIEEENYPHKSFFETEELADSLREGVKLVEALHSELRHDETTCTCETCSWIRNAEHLTEEFEHHLPHVEPDLHHHEHGETPAE